MSVGRVPSSSSSGTALTRVYCAAATSNMTLEPSRRIPISIPKDQLYFWTATWQASEARADADFAAGRSTEYDNFEALARDLLSAE